MGLVEFLRHKGSLKLSKNSRTISITVGAQFRASLRGGNSGKFSRIPPISSLVATAIKAYRWHKRIFPVFISDIYSFDCAKWGKNAFRTKLLNLFTKCTSKSMGKFEFYYDRWMDGAAVALLSVDSVTLPLQQCWSARYAKSFSSQY